mgnify:CR=1 FL=1
MPTDIGPAPTRVPPAGDLWMPAGIVLSPPPVAVYYMEEMDKLAARAREAEMQAQVIEMRARVTEAEAEVPKAIAKAFREGHLGVMDYYKLRNVQADTEMRKSIAGAPAPKA